MTNINFKRFYRNLENKTTIIDIQLWILVLVSMSGDIILTIVGLELGFVEFNPIVVLGIEMIGYAVLAFLKVPALIIGLLAWIFMPLNQRELILVGLSLPWLIASLYNGWIIVSRSII